MKIENFMRLCLLLLVIPHLGHTKDALPEKVEPPQIGNFSVPTSQQPGPLVSFGQNVIGESVVQIVFAANATFGNNIYTTEVLPQAIYGITDSFSCLFGIPLFPSNKGSSQISSGAGPPLSSASQTAPTSSISQKSSQSSGVGDMFAQFEYAFLSWTNPSSIDQATIVAGITFPTGSASKNPPTGFGSTSFFVGTTFNHTGINWFFFTSPGIVVTTSHNGTHFGNQFLYQFGVGRHIPSPAGWLFDWMIEIDGTYAWKNKIRGEIDQNSGGNTIYLTPSMYIANRRIVIQLGAGYPIVQNLFGDQPKTFASLNFALTITF